MHLVPHTSRPASTRASLGGFSAVVLLALTLHTVFGGRALAAQNSGMRDSTLIRHLAVVATKQVNRLTNRQSIRPDVELGRLAASQQLHVIAGAIGAPITPPGVSGAIHCVILGARLLDLPPPIA